MNSLHHRAHELASTYAEAVNLREPQVWAACWHDAATWQLADGRMLRGIDEITRTWHDAMGHHRMVFQALAHGTVREIEGRLTGLWHFTEYAWRADAGTGALLLAHYEDEYVEDEDGALRFSHRRLVRHYHGSPQLTDAPLL
ncbi:nuclear transport factor 2 family protein [Dietzia lutea]|uniref:SnoaL-like domain-containing protein n=1 Tax=Dietzia lutea TaxID=546160 RepID=A0A2S1R9T9_9ACTN|nr:nuclear transport factor 2 family protein [Dietzia lutea]AWH93059.1 hypothetical protein A6035_13755 [Dietzia lutea]